MNDEPKTNWGVSNDKPGGINVGNIGNELCYFWRADAVYRRIECWERKLNIRQTYISGRPICCGSPGS